MPSSAIFLQRLAQQRLWQSDFRHPAEAVSWLGAVQSQDYPGALWSSGLRLAAATEKMIEQAFTEGSILRTHVMRPTWHFVCPADIRWLLELTAPRVQAANAFRYRQLELDEFQLGRSQEIIVRALAEGQYLTRTELGIRLAEAGINADGQRLAYILMNAELNAQVCSGPRRGKHFTYALLAERAPDALRLPRPAALAELTRRYFTGHGPATARDLSWWSGLALADIKTGLALAADTLQKIESDGQVYYVAAKTLPAPQAAGAAFLLPTFDELFVGYRNFDKARVSRQGIARRALFDAMIVLDDDILGSWQRALQKERVVIEIAPFSSPHTPAQNAAIAEAAQRYANFVGKKAILVEVG